MAKNLENFFFESRILMYKKYFTKSVGYLRDLSYIYNIIVVLMVMNTQIKLFLYVSSIFLQFLTGITLICRPASWHLGHVLVILFMTLPMIHRHITQHST